VRYYSYSFQVGGPRTGYRCSVEVKALNKKRAAMLIRARIRKMPDVESVPQFHYTEVVVGLPVLESAGHDHVKPVNRTRPAPLTRKVGESIYA
jgi:hypothetical protein